MLTLVDQIASIKVISKSCQHFLKIIKVREKIEIYSFHPDGNFCLDSI